VSYPRNAASPERVDIGAVVQISDGAVQTAGVAVKEIPFGSTEASGGGTITYSTDGIVIYTPTQAETDYTSFILIASKSGCIPASKTVVTSAASVAGRTLPADGSITAAVIADNAIDTATFATGTTIPRCTLVDTTTTNSDMRGTDSANTTTPPTVGAIADEVQTRTIARVTLVDTTTTNTDMRGTDNAALAETALSTATWTNNLAAALSPIRSNKAQAGASTTITLDASASAVDDFYVPCGIYLTGGTGAGQFRTIDSYNGTTKVADVSESWYVTPDNTTTFAIRPEGVAHADTRAINGNEISAGYLKSLADQYGTAGYVSAAVASMATDVITAAAVSAAAVTKIQSGLATAAELLLVKDRVSYCLTVLIGACADAGTSAETYVHAIGGETFTVDFTGLDATGNRTTTTLSKV